MISRANKISYTKSLFKKFFWRIHFLFVESWGMDPLIISYTLFPFMRFKDDFREKLIEKRGIISLNKSGEYFIYKDIKINYKKNLPFGDFISIFLNDNKYILKNFLNNSAFKLEGSYESGDVVLKAGDVVVDAGANIGLFSLFASSNIGQNGKVLAFEPVIETRSILNKNISDNNLKNIQVIPMALGEKKGILTLSINTNELGSSSAIFNDGNAKESVSLTTLDDYIKENNIQKIDFIKADIEGMEKQFLLGSRESIKRFKPKLSICTYHLPEDPEYIEKLVLSYVPEYKILHTNKKLYAHI